MKKIYCISGLGADEKAFAKIKLPGYELGFIQWLTPGKNESIEAYATRMSKSIKEENPILMGLSFGGIMCIEIAKLLPVKKLILISSVPAYKQIPLWMRTAGKLRLNKVLPIRSASTLLEPVQNYHIGAATAEEKEIVRQYRKMVSPVYLHWAINAILNWKNEWHPASLYHIHGDADRIFPIKNVKPDHIIKGGTHFMIFTKAREISEKLALVLQ
ncbi:MAG: alpha/beta hydrolase [Chitinophagaceae bacterium]|nr:alpha/beta hydrolase [Chitinophagaceae bacterium]